MVQAEFKQKPGVDFTTLPARSRMLPWTPRLHLGSSDWID
jgi:hypothetical protein